MSSEKRRVKRGRKPIANNPNRFCRVCKCNLQIKLGNCSQSCENLFKRSSREGSRGVILATLVEKVYSKPIARVQGLSEVVCKPCGRKIRSLLALYESVKLVVDEASPANVTNVDDGATPPATPATGSSKRKALEVITPNRSSPSNRKVGRASSPSIKSKKSLQFSLKERENLAMVTAFNVDDLNTVQGQSSDLKVVIAYPNGNVVIKNNLDSESKGIIRNIALQQWKTAVNLTFRHKDLSKELLAKLENEVEREMRDYCRSDSILKTTDPDQLASLSNKVLCKEVELNCPLYSSVVKSACNANDKPENGTNAVALATAVLVRCRNPKMSALAYRISSLLFHSGVSYRDATRLHHLGVCMSPRMTIELHHKMGANSDYKAMVWKREIEKNKVALLLLEEVREKQLKRAADDMVVDVPLDVSKSTLHSYHNSSDDAISKVESCIENVKSKMGEINVNEDVLLAALRALKSEKLPYYK